MAAHARVGHSLGKGRTDFDSPLPTEHSLHSGMKKRPICRWVMIAFTDWARQSTALRKIGLRSAGENLGWPIGNHKLISG